MMEGACLSYGGTTTTEAQMMVVQIQPLHMVMGNVQYVLRLLQLE